MTTAPTAAILLAALTTTPVYAQGLSATKDAGNATGAALLAGMEADRSGTLEGPDVANFARALVLSMDADASGDLTRAEMVAWRGGVRDIAAYRGRTLAYETMASVLFDVADRDADGSVTVAEQVDAVLRISARADVDGDGVTTTAEFDRHSIVAIGLRTAVASPPV